MPKKNATMSMRLAARPSMMTTTLAKMDTRMPGTRKRSLTVAADEAVARSAHGLDEDRPPSVVAELLPQAADENVDRPVVGVPVDASGLVQDALASEDPTAVAHEEREQLELRGGELEGAPPEVDGAGGEAHLQVPHSRALFVIALRRPPQDSLDSSDQLARL